MSLILILLMLVSIAHAEGIPAGVEKFQCGTYELEGIFSKKKVSSTEFTFHVYPMTKRSFEVTLKGYFGVEVTTLKDAPTKVIASFKTSNDAKNRIGKIISLKGVKQFSPERTKPMVRLVKPSKCQKPI